MNQRYFSILSTLSAFAVASTMILPSALPAVAAEVEQDYEVLTRGPVHEAFAETVSFDPAPGLIVRTRPPEPIEELPPEQQLEGDNVTWIAGYWAWDDEENDFLWVSGIWRNLPPGRQWVPGYWSEIDGGQFQWTSGYWADSEANEVSYIPNAPPRSLEVGPNVPPPSDDQSWIPGNWAWGESRYAWRPGYWAPLRPNWTWMPSRYCWTRRGYIYVDGYWDYDVASRGVVFAPVHFHRHVYDSPDYFYTPSIVIGLDVFRDHLFVRPRCGHYYFGDYYASRYRDAGFHASFSWHSGRRGYDPIYAYERWNNRHDRTWERRRHNDFNYFRDHEAARPSHTYAAMRDARGDRFNDGRNRSFATSLDSVAENPRQGQRFRVLDKDRRSQFVSQRQEMRHFGQGRRQLETRGNAAGGASSERIPVREKLARSPITGGRVDRLASNEAPPTRPQPRGTNIRPNPAGDARTQLGIGRRDESRIPGERQFSITESKGEGRAAARNLPPRFDGVGTLPGADRERGGQQAHRFPGRQAGDVKATQPRETTRQIPERRTEGSPQRPARPIPQEARETPEPRIQMAPPRQSLPQPQARQVPERRTEGSPQRPVRPIPQEARETPEPRIQMAPPRQSLPQPQARQAPDRTPRAVPQRHSQPKPQVRQTPQHRPQMALQRQSPPNPRAHQSPDRMARVVPQRHSQPKPQVRQTPQRQPQMASHHQPRPNPQARQAPQRMAHAAPQHHAQPRQQVRPASKAPGQHRGGRTDDNREEKRRNSKS